MLSSFLNRKRMKTDAKRSEHGLTFSSNTFELKKICLQRASLTIYMSAMLQNLNIILDMNWKFSAHTNFDMLNMNE